LAIELTETFEDGLPLGVTFFVVGGFTKVHDYVQMFSSFALGLKNNKQKRKGDYAKRHEYG
jgi:hypothetical protein